MVSFIEFSATMSISFYRGLLMHFAVPRDAEHRTGYSMVAVNPQRVGKGSLQTFLTFVQSNHCIRF